MEISKIIFIVLGAVSILAGLASIFTRKVYLMGNSMSKYTDESLKKYAVPGGIMNIIVGGGLIASELLRDQKITIGTFELPLGLASIIAALIIVLVIWAATRKILVKK